MDERTDQSEINLIRDRLDALEAASAEKSKPWYREPSSFLSFVAIVASVITFVISQRSQDVQDIRARKEQLESLLTNLLDIPSELTNAAKTSSDPLAFEQQSAVLNQKNLIFLEEAEILMDQLGKNVSSSEYNVLASQMLSTSNYAKAEVYYKKSLGAAHDGLNRAIALRNLAQFYFMPSQFRDFDRGRNYFQESVDAMKDTQGDDYSKYAVGFSYEVWGWREKASGFAAEGNKLLERAQKTYETMSLQNPLRQRALQSFLSRLNGPLPAQGQAAPTPDSGK